MSFARLVMITTFAMVGACAPAEISPGLPLTKVPIASSAGVQAGAVSWWPEPDATHIKLTVNGLAPGRHGVHFHAVGRCDGPDFTTAGGHWNPDNKKHGHKSPAGWHLGDLGNITVPADGAVEAMLLLPPGTDFADADGTALVIHAGPDDEMTDPSGNSGGRIACAVIAPAVK